METALIIILIVAVLAITYLALPSIISSFKKESTAVTAPLPSNYGLLLNEHVNFYKQLDASKKAEFENRMQVFLSRIKITGVRTTVEDIDRVLIAAGAIIPIFGFADWEYINLHEVLLYPDAFSDGFDQKGKDRDILGMVGSGAYQNIMILSQQQLRAGFENATSKSNTAIHEFVHLIDKTDGAVDGVPESILSDPLVRPWLDKIHESIKQIMENRSDINPYGATNAAEFFAVVSEYFFKRPDLLQNNHRQLYELLVTIFKQQPKNASDAETAIDPV